MRLQISLLFFVFLAAQVSAQSPPPSAAAVEAARQQAAQIEARQQSEEDASRASRLSQAGTPSASLTEAPPEPTNPEGFKICFTRITIEDYTLLRPEFIVAIQLKNENKELGMEEVNNILREITNAYMLKGFITCRAYLPEQDITSGELRIKCVEGKLEDFTGAIESTFINPRTAFPGLRGRPLNLRDLEQGIDQLNRLPSNDVKNQIEPGKEFGGSIVALSNKVSKRWRIFQSIDNSGFGSTGEYQERSTFQYDNGFELNDQLTASYGRDVTSSNDGNFSEAASLSFSVPYGYWLFDASASYFTYDSQLPVAQFDLSSSGETWNFNLGGSYLFHRDQTTKSTFHFGLNYGIVENFLNGLKLDVSSRQVAIGSIGVSHSRHFRGGQLYSRLNYDHSLRIFNAYNESDQLTPDSLDGNFGILSIDNHYSKRLTIPGGEKGTLIWSSNLKIQYTPDQLFSSQQVSLGGQSTIRGFKEETILSGSAFYWRNDFIHPLLNVRKATRSIFGHINGFAAYDIGSGYGPDRPTSQKGIIHGVATGMRFADGKLNGELSVGFPIDAPNFITEREPVFFGSFNTTF